MTPIELNQIIQSTNFEEQNFIIDVREISEWEFNRLPNAHHFPLNELVHNIDKLSKNKRLIMYCHHGVRSQHACELLKGLSFDMVDNLEGGIHRWSLEVDPTVKQY